MGPDVIALIITLLTTLFIVFAVVVSAVGVVLLTLAPFGVLLALMPKLLEQARERDRARQQAWAAVGAELGLALDGERLHGRIRGHEVVVSIETVRINDTTYSYTDAKVGGVPETLGLGTESVLGRAFSGPDPEVGDPSFDEQFRIQGPPEGIGYLDHRARQAITSADGKVSVGAGSVTLRADGRVAEAERLARLVAQAVDCAEALASERSLAKRLAEASRADPLPGVRARMLDELARAFPQDARPAATEALAATDPALRLAGARFLRDVPTLAAVAADPAADLGCRTDALVCLADCDAPDALGLALLAALSTPDAAPLWHAGMQAARTHRPPGAVEALLHLAAEVQPERWGDSNRRRRYRQAAEQVCGVLGDLADPAAEDTLMQLLRAPDDAVAVAAASALGRLGTVDAVPALRAAEEAAPMLSSTRAPLRAAIRAIQSRATGERGGLAVAEAKPDIGALSQARADRGRLSE